MKWPYTRVEFSKSGDPADPEQVEKALEVVRGRGPGQTAAPTDLLVIAHGWNNGRDAAERLFTTLGDNIADLAEHENVPGGRFAILGIQWPSIRWADEDQIVGGGASAGDELVALESAIGERVEEPVVAAELQGLAGKVDASATARAEFVDRLRTLLPTDATAAATDPADSTADDDPVPDAFLHGDAEDLFARAAEAERDLDRLDAPIPEGDRSDLPPGVFPDLLDDATTAAGFDLGLPDFKRVARRLLNYTTYYTMKKRSRTVGERGLAPLLGRIADAAGPGGVRLHLVGHSFGARVVTSAAARSTPPIESLSLLQAAFSHRAFSSTVTPPGAFRHVLDGPLAGPCLVTHTHNDRAVLMAYAVASRVAGQSSAGLGDADDPYGGLGANGAVATDRADAGTLGDDAHTYTFTPGRIRNLLADDHISGHSDVTNRAVANAVLQVMLVR